MKCVCGPDRAADYNILILKDYMPTIGKVKGSVQIEGYYGESEMISMICIPAESVRTFDRRGYVC